VPPLTLRPSLPTIVVNVVKRLACDYYHLRTISGQRHTNSEPGPLRHRDFSSIPALDEFQWSCLSEASKLRISDALSDDLVDPMSASGQTRAWARAIVRSALPPITAVTDRRINVRFVPILLQKSQKAPRLIFRQRTKQATIADQCSLKPVIGVVRKFGARRRGPPGYYSISRLWL
jgi:hypothetical protein